MVTDATPVAVAAAVVDLARAGRFDAVEQMFSPELRAVVSAEALRIGWTGELSRIGPICVVEHPVVERSAGGLARVSVPLRGERGGLTVMMSVDEVGALHGLRLAAPSPVPWRAPDYADSVRFSEREVTLGSGAHAVPGTLTLPRDRGRHPGVVLLSGGGPFDRDATSGVNKPFKDLAWGLASRGVAVVRFDKVTFVDGRVASEPGFTATDEYVPCAIAAVRLLQRQRGVDPKRVHILGHSMGGRVAPRVAAADPSVAGLVVLAGDTSSMARAVVRVARHIASVSPGSIPPDAIEAIERQVALVSGPDLSPSTPAADLPFGWSVSYWLDLLHDDPVATAAGVERPMLILQGGRDYQVTVADDLAGWRSGLAHRSDVDIRVYESDDHMFYRGEGISTPAGYEPEQHVDPDAVADIAEWLTRAA